MSGLMNAQIIAIIGVLALLSITLPLHQNIAYAQATTSSASASASATSVSIVQGSSSPTISKPYDPSPLTVKAGTSVTWTNRDSSI
ncbi:MAG TPA: hypothetical protein VJ729_05420, partial [Nitrososphaeraceae archaeon]|nr:hypothetical protein [Nitrososphaeraceae archaeon]